MSRSQVPSEVSWICGMSLVLTTSLAKGRNFAGSLCLRLASITSPDTTRLTSPSCILPMYCNSPLKLASFPFKRPQPVLGAQGLQRHVAHVLRPQHRLPSLGDGAPAVAAFTVQNNHFLEAAVRQQGVAENS